MTATKVLVAGGVADLTYGFLLGLALSSARMKHPEAPRHLVTTHLAAIIQGAVLLSLTAALRFTAMASTLEAAAASFLVAGSVLFLAGTTASWLQRVGDHFAVRSVGWKLLVVSAPLNLAGITIVLLGVAMAL